MTTGPSTIDRLSDLAVERIRLLPSPQEVRFTVYGIAKPAGSKRAFVLRNRAGAIVMNKHGAPAVNVIDSCVKGKEWRREVANAARAAYDGELFRCAVEVTMLFFRARPKGHFGSGKKATTLKASAPKYPTPKPDVLKLARLVEDSLTGVLYADDSATVTLSVAKRYGEPARVEVTVKPIE